MLRLGQKQIIIAKDVKGGVDYWVHHLIELTGYRPDPADVPMDKRIPLAVGSLVLRPTRVERDIFKEFSDAYRRETGNPKAFLESPVFLGNTFIKDTIGIHARDFYAGDRVMTLQIVRRCFEAVTGEDWELTFNGQRID